VSAGGWPRLREVLEEAKRRGFLGPGPVEQHALHSRAYAGAGLGGRGPVADLGSGGGVPGLVLAMLLPDVEVVLMEANLRRCAFLAEAVAGLGLVSRVDVVRERAEIIGHDAHHRGRYGTVVARSFGPPPVTAECGAALLASGGRLLVSEPPEEQFPSKERWPAAGLARLGLVHMATVAGPARIAVLEQVQPCPAMYPRRVGVPAKRPLW
jgi:16S rRNA (guanine527-N7)-methyltransferase